MRYMHLQIVFMYCTAVVIKIDSESALMELYLRVGLYYPVLYNIPL